MTELLTLITDLAICFGFAVGIICLLPRRKRSHLHLLMRAPQTPGAESSSEPSAESGKGKRRDFSQ